jgi:hypothetical protein
MQSVLLAAVHAKRLEDSVTTNNALVSDGDRSLLNRHELPIKNRKFVFY